MRFLAKFSPAAEPQVLQFGLSLLRLIGLWDATGSRRMLRYLTVVSCLVTLLIIPKALFGSGKEGFDYFARNVAELIFFTEVCIAVGIFAIRRKSFTELVDLLRKIIARFRRSEKCFEEIRSFNRSMDTFAKGYFLYIGLMVVLFFFMPIGYSLFMWCFVMEDKRGDYILTIDLQLFSLDIHRNILHYAIAEVFCMTPVCCSAFQSIIKGAVFLVIIRYGTKLFELIETRIKCLDQVTADQARKDELREIIELHQLSLRYVELLEKTMNFILMNQILNCMFIWCLMMFYISTNFGTNATTILILFIVLMCEMVVYCFSGSNLSQQAAAVGDAIYHHPWYLEPMSMQKDMMMIIQRAQRPTGVTAARFYFVNIQRLGIVLQASYSYYLLLKNVF